MAASKRRGRGEGTVRQRSDGRWEARVSQGFDGHGKRVTRSVYGKTKTEVLQKLRDMPAHLFVDVKDLSIRDFLTAWLEKKSRERRRNTHRRYEQLARLHALPFLGQLRVSQVKPHHVEALYRELLALGRSADTVRKVGVMLHAMFTEAVVTEVTTANPVARIPPLEAKVDRMHAFSRNEADAFLEASTPDRNHALYCLALCCGCRQGELLALSWRDIDFDQSTVTVSKTLEESRGGLRLVAPKTKNGRRTIAAPGVVMQALNEHRQFLVADGTFNADIVFPTTRGTWQRKANLLQRSFYPIIERATLPRIRFHDLRHTCATLLLQAGTNVKLVSETLGHRDISTTLQIYGHVLKDERRSAADTMQNLFG